ncbi:MAG: pilus assembly PilX N-terminal domain-containing protein [Planctomycetota bacterium]|nr:pilus assembly PilX N-terminal domain-containing protein [Planctomycetota bacterium]
MRSQGSVLIVVLGLLAILAIVGVTFVTMSSMDRTTASNFALQSQFMLAADGAVDYLCHHLVTDLWLFNAKAAKGTASGDAEDPYGDSTPLLTDLKDLPDISGSVTPAPSPRTDFRYALLRNEPWDAPGTVTGAALSVAPEDPWLATTLDWDTVVDLARSEMGGSQQLSSGITFAYSYGSCLSQYPAPPVSQRPYGLNCWWTREAPISLDYTNRANNLGIPGGDAESKTINLSNPLRAVHVDPYWPPSGVWIPELSFPFESGIIRVSVTVQDHAAMVNANIHGNGGDLGGQTFSDATGRGYFVSDIAPAKETLGIDPGILLTGGGGEVGRWPMGVAPNNLNRMQTEIENPGTTNRPFTLEEEFELRRLLGTSYRSRLENIAKLSQTTLFEMDPDANRAQALGRPLPNEQALRRRMCLTTVSWTSEVTADPWAVRDPGNQSIFLLHTGAPPGGTYSARKANINLDAPEDIFRVLWHGRAFDHLSPVQLAQFKQFVANIVGFRDGWVGSGVRLWPLRLSSASPIPTPQEQYLAASRQPIISELAYEAPTPPDTIAKVRVELFSPWEGDCVGDKAGLTFPNNCQLNAMGASNSVTGLSGRMPGEGIGSGPVSNCRVIELNVDIANGTLSGKLTYIKLVVRDPTKGDIVLDEVDVDEIKALESSPSLYRPIYVAWQPTDAWGDKRGAKDDWPVRVVYIGDWMPGKNGTVGLEMGSWAQPAAPPDPRIPIRFPRSCHGNRLPTTKPLPIRATTAPQSTTSVDDTFLAVPRIGDLSQILWWNGTGSFWPWVRRVSRAGRDNLTDKDFKFPWVGAGPAPSDPSTYATNTFSPLFAANVLCVSGPWCDGIDNDNDGATDDRQPALMGVIVDKGEDGSGRFGGPELRVAGRINLNTATETALRAIENGVSVTGLCDTVMAARQNGRILTPAVVLDAKYKDKLFGLSSGGGQNLSDDEKRREAFARISNLVTVRSDTYSIYGTVQYVDASSALRKNATSLAPYVKRTRRFWALVDRSPTAAFSPADVVTTSPKFIHPRILNFQWMD